MIILTGGAGFIGSNLLKSLNRQHISEVIIVDDLNHPLKKRNIKNLLYTEIVPINDYWKWQKNNSNLEIDGIFHLGACTDTLETNKDFLYENNVLYSQMLWEVATNKQTSFIYASSAATYGNGCTGFSDDHSLIPKLKPLNPYGQSKQDFDLWVLEQKDTPSHWVGLKYFNVYGPGEEHKGRMASVVFHFLQQLEQNQNLKLFNASHGYDAGEQKRDFIYVGDAVKMTMYAFNQKIPSGIYNVGTGRAKTFNELAETLFSIIGDREKEYIPFPARLLESYQAFTCADMQRFYKAGYKLQYYDLKKGIGLCFNAYNRKIKN